MIAHEMAHSWSGNLVTNATWRDFWLNEGVTTYISIRIMEAVYGPERADVEAVLEKGLLTAELARLPPADQILHVDLKGRDPDQDGSTEIPYAKGHAVPAPARRDLRAGAFRFLPAQLFRELRFPQYHHGGLCRFLKPNLLDNDLSLASTIPLDQWLYQPGLPADAPKPVSSALAKVDAAGQGWMAGKIATASLPGRSWSTQEWLEFLRNLPPDVGRERMADLDRSFSLTGSGNAEITAEWLKTGDRESIRTCIRKLEQFLTTVGRRKYRRAALRGAGEDARRPSESAAAIFAKARAGYHPLAVQGVQAILSRPGKS